MSESKTKKIGFAMVAVLVLAAILSIALCWNSDDIQSDTFENGINGDNLKDIQKKASDNPDYTVTITSPEGKIVLDGKAVSSLSDGGDLSISKTTLPENTQTILGDCPAYNISLGNNTDFGDGNVTVYVASDENRNGTDGTAYYINSDGTVCGILYMQYKDGYAVFSTNHFSTYALSSDNAAGMIATKISSAGGIFGEFSDVSKIDEHTYSATAPVEYTGSSGNTVYIHVGEDAKRVYDDMSSVIRSGIEFMGEKSTVLCADGISNATVAKIDVTAPLQITVVYFSINIGNVTVYAVSSENGSAVPSSGLMAIGGNASYSEISDAVSSVIGSFDSVNGNITVSSAVKMAESFVSSYTGTAFGKFSVTSDSDASSATASSDNGKIVWTVDSDGNRKYIGLTDEFDAKVSDGSAVMLDYSGCDYASAYLSEGKLVLFAFYDGILIDASVTVGSASANDVLEISNFIVKTIGFSFRDNQAFTLLDVVKDFVSSATAFETYGAWHYDENTGVNSSAVQYHYTSGMNKAPAYFHIRVTVEEDIDAAYSALAATVIGEIGNVGAMGNNYSLNNISIEGGECTAVSFHGGTMGGVKFVMKVGNILIDGSGTQSGNSFVTGTADGEKAYLYIRGEGEEAQNAQIGKILSAFASSASKFGSEFRPDIGGYAKEFTNFEASKGTWSVENSDEYSATLRLSYENSSGSERFTRIFATLENDSAAKYGELSAKVLALDGTTFLKSTVYSVYSAEIPGIEYTAVAYSGDSMGGLRFVMTVGNIVIDGSGLESGSDYPYVYINGGKDSFDSLVSEFLKALNTAFTGGKIEKNDPSDDKIHGDDSPAGTSAIKAAESFMNTHTVGNWGLADGGNDTSASLVLTYTSRTGDKTVNVDLYRKADSSLYGDLSAKVLSLDGTAAMGDSFKYGTIEFAYGDVSVAAVGSQLSSSYFLRFVMTYGNVVIDANTNGYIYLSGSDCAENVRTLLTEFAEALIKAAPSDADYSSGAGFAADAFVKADKTGMWSHAESADSTDALLTYTYVTSSNKEKTANVAFYHGSDAAAKYAGIASAIRAYIGTTTMSAEYFDLELNMDGCSVTAVGAQLSTSLFLRFAIQNGDYLVDASTNGYIYILGSDGKEDAAALVARFAAVLSAVNSDATRFAEAFANAYHDYFFSESAATVGKKIAESMPYGTWTVSEDSGAGTATLTMKYVTSTGKNSEKSFVIYRGQPEITYDSLSATLSAEEKYTAFTYTYDGISVTAATLPMGEATMLKFVMSCGNYIVDGYTGTYVYIYGVTDSAAVAKSVLDAFAAGLNGGIVTKQTWTAEKSENGISLRLGYTTSTGAKTKDFGIFDGDGLTEKYTELAGKLDGDSKYVLLDYVSADGISVHAAVRTMGTTLLLKFVMTDGNVLVDATSESINITTADANDAVAMIKAFENIMGAMNQ